MDSRTLRHIERTFALQHDQSDCGVACLLSLVRYYGGNSSLENIRTISGTSAVGTTLLGLSLAAAQLGFEAQGCKADMDALMLHSSPVVLHVHLNDWLQHYVVCYGRMIKKGKPMLIIGDPGKGVVKMPVDELSSIWRSGFCLTLETGGQFEKQDTFHRRRKAWFRALIKEDIPLLLIATGLGILIAGLGTAMMIFSQRLIDNIIPNRDYTRLFTGLPLVLFLLLAREAGVALRTHFLITQSQAFNVRIIDRFYTHLLGLPGIFFDTRKIGEFTARLTDTARIQKVISLLAGNAIIDGLAILVLFSFLFFYSWKIAAVCFIAMPFYYWLILAFRKPILNRQHQIMADYAQAESNFISSFRGIDPIRNYNKQGVFGQQNKTVYGRYQESVFQLGRTQVNLAFLANGFGILLLGTVILVGTVHVLQGTLKTGALIAVIGMCTSLLSSVANLALVSIPLNEAKIAFNRMFEYTGMNVETETGLTLDRFQSLAIRSMSFRFPGQLPLLKDISIDVRKGEIIAVMGENGCGKSTIGKIIQKKYLPENTSIFVNGTIALDSISFASWRKTTALVAQDAYLFNGTVLENIAFDDARDKREEVLEFLREYGFDSFILGLPQSYLTIIGETGVALSGGQKQLVAFARALYHRPQLLILDETNAALDRVAEQFMLNLLERLRDRMATIIISHRLHILKSICVRIYVIDNGKVSVSGNHEHLLRSENLYSSYWKDLGFS